MRIIFCNKYETLTNLADIAIVAREARSQSCQYA